MHETVWLGRGGQGAFTAARLLGIAAMLSAKHALAMPSFGPERRGAPVFAYTRIADEKVYDRSAVQRADAAVILDESLLGQVATGFLTPETLLVIDSEESVEGSAPSRIAAHVVRVPARRIAREVIGSEHTNSVMFGALVGLTGVVERSAAEEGIRRELGTGSRGVRNLEAFQLAYALAEEHTAQGVASV